MTGAIVFLVAIGAAFTGYLSQQNFDSQWIASEGKDGLNSVGIGAFFNVVDFGQMYTWHVILLPVAVVALVVWHVLLVRRHGVVPPYPAKVGRRPTAAGVAGRGSARERRRRPSSARRPESREWHGPVRPLRPGQGVRRRAGGDHGAGRSILAILFSSPDDKPMTIQQLGAAPIPRDFVATAVTELDGTERGRRPTARPTTTRPEPARRSARSTCRARPGVHFPIDTAQDFVLDPLREHPGERRASSGAARRTRPRRRPSRQPGPTPTRRRSTHATFPAGSRSCRPATTGRSRR